MKKVEFNEVDTNRFDVYVDEDRYGTLEFDKEQNCWVLWPDSIDDGVSYFDDLQETKETITDELND
ncbi:hypothetical protein [Lactobacillus sp. ESL0230]|uniref:hypothetical protein n=1 Tax=Lactobacillus sp. ESL0230 TaxID=2069353 RepID=UPI000EFC74AD|nr:hypothetical protein [Lactobacillus sp. ESL0230]RMC46556.1 hypothetical protein F5ESL0230_04680 [Lactobacillus sp. ESL0230]